MEDGIDFQNQNLECNELETHGDLTCRGAIDVSQHVTIHGTGLMSNGTITGEYVRATDYLIKTETNVY